MTPRVERIAPTVKLKTTILKSSLCNYSDKYILVKATIRITEAEQAGNSGARQAAKEVDKKIKK